MTVVSAPLSADVTTGVLPGVVEDRIADLIGAMVAAAGGSYNATTGTITLPGTDPEVVRDTIVTALRAATGGMITITPNDAGDTITLGVDTAALSDSIAAGVAPKLDKGGGTMTGALVLAGPQQYP